MPAQPADHAATTAEPRSVGPVDGQQPRAAVDGELAPLRLDLAVGGDADRCSEVVDPQRTPPGAGCRSGSCRACRSTPRTAAGTSTSAGLHAAIGRRACRRTWTAATSAPCRPGRSCRCRRTAAIPTRGGRRCRRSSGSARASTPRHRDRGGGPLADSRLEPVPDADGVRVAADAGGVDEVPVVHPVDGERGDVHPARLAAADGADGVVEFVDAGVTREVVEGPAGEHGQRQALVDGDGDRGRDGAVAPTHAEGNRVVADLLGELVAEVAVRVRFQDLHLGSSVRIRSIAPSLLPAPGLTSTIRPAPRGSRARCRLGAASPVPASRTAHHRRVDTATAVPSAKPATTSEGQCTPTCTREYADRRGQGRDRRPRGRVLEGDAGGECGRGGGMARRERRRVGGMHQCPDHRDRPRNRTRPPRQRLGHGVRERARSRDRQQPADRSATALLAGQREQGRDHHPQLAVVREPAQPAQRRIDPGRLQACAAVDQSDVQRPDSAANRARASHGESP